ncbi:DUF4890 domain-containing protein [Pontibacter sp. E15-1]|uniref:DUF4890 domain-containing protein n=1 Tax=Pontibacter sp. E15-1 TaxID=2919918 RepID=UPI001F4FAF8B|nr:DUF4890 domain-containing protein [Pontibacter sp. E15-1]MCJ8166355.1 DUF4890 domain-containing protein [Pontibacter sp. E15-1]
MKKILVIACMIFGSAFAASAQGNLATIAQERATNLSHQMIREFRLNNYQSRKISEINLFVAQKMLSIEQEYAGNQNKIKELCDGVCAIRDTKLENILSTEQYNDYYGSRKILLALDKEFMANTAYRGNNNNVASAGATAGNVN